MNRCLESSGFLSSLEDEISTVTDLKIPAILLFGLPGHKDATGSEAYQTGGIVQQAVRAVKKLAPELVIATDVCLLPVHRPRTLWNCPRRNCG